MLVRLLRWLRSSKAERRFALKVDQTRSIQERLRCDGVRHVWIPLILGDAPYGSLGSQIGYACECGAQDVRWPETAFKAGVDERALLTQNAVMQREGAA